MINKKCNHLSICFTTCGLHVVVEAGFFSLGFWRVPRADGLSNPSMFWVCPRVSQLHTRIIPQGSDQKLSIPDGQENCGFTLTLLKSEFVGTSIMSQDTEISSLLLAVFTQSSWSHLRIGTWMYKVQGLPLCSVLASLWQSFKTSTIVPMLYQPNIAFENSFLRKLKTQMKYCLY